MKHYYASHYLYVQGQGFLRQQVVETEDGHVLRFYALKGEMPHVEWYPGVLRIDADGTLSHYFPFDFKTMQPVSETRRTQLR